MNQRTPIRVAINGYGVIGKRVADAVLAQDDMVLAGVADIVTDWRLRPLGPKGIALYAATPEHASSMTEAGVTVTGVLDDLLEQADVVVDCTPKRVAAKNVEPYRAREIKFIVHGGEPLVRRRSVFRQRDRPHIDPRCLLQHHLHRPDPHGAEGGRPSETGTRDASEARYRSLGKPRRRHYEHARPRT
jgi:hypothetical protein